MESMEAAAPDCSALYFPGAKSSCAAKIAMAVENGILGYEMYRNGQQFYGGDGIITKGVENTFSANQTIVSLMAYKVWRDNKKEVNIYVKAK